jgi:hypothetical protein
MAIDVVSPTSRRSALRLVAFGSILSAFPGVGRVLAQDQTVALLVSRPGTLGPDFEELNGARICAGGRAGASGVAPADALRARGATILTMSTHERYLALERGICIAALFIGDDYSRLESDVRAFFPGVAAYEIRRFP